jgi:hypothetical protein
MPTNVVPAWVKYLLLFACVAVGLWSFTGKSLPSKHETSTYLTGGTSEAASGFPAKTGANIRQFVTNPLEPTPVPDDGTVILRSSGTNYYRDQP